MTESGTSKRSDRDLSIVPDISFGFLEKTMRHILASPGTKEVDKGCKYFREKYITDIREADEFPNLPVQNLMQNYLSVILDEQTTVKMNGLRVTKEQMEEIEKLTGLQAQDPKWYKIRKERITTSVAGDIRRRNDEDGYSPKESHKHYHQIMMQLTYRIGVVPLFRMDGIVVSSRAFGYEKNIWQDMKK